MGPQTDGADRCATGPSRAGVRRVPELLAPAGTYDAALAALVAGADAVYLGFGEFNARAALEGLSDDELARACALAHARAARVYVTLNVFIRDDELDRAVGLARRAATAGADALIVADWGLMRSLRRALPAMELHLSTQAGAASPEAVRLAADELGCTRVTCARELSVAEIAELAATGVEIEAFCHGAICISWSGACSFSALRLGRSAMRGDCAQPCRRDYALVDDAGAVLSDPDAPKLLCPRDYLGIRHLDALATAGVAALKIEGRMKNPDYVFNVVGAYRAALDAIAAGGEYDADALARRLARSFNRGFTDAYLVGGAAGTGAALMSPERSCNQGLRVGEVVRRRRHEVLVRFDEAVRAADTLEIRTILPADAGADVPRRWPLVPSGSDVAAGELAWVRCKRRVEAGSPVYLVASSDVLDASRAAVESLRVEADAWAADAAAAPAREQGERGVDGGAAGASALGFGAHRIADHPAAHTGVSLGDAARVVAPASPASPVPGPAMVLVRDLGRARELLAADPLREVAVLAWALEDRLDPGDDIARRLAVVLDEMMRPGDAPRVRELCRRFGRVVCRNMGQVAIARREVPRFDVAAPVFCASAETARILRNLGAERIYLPDELSPNDAARIASALPALQFAHGLPAPRELMVMEHCVLTAEGPCTHACAVCPRRRERRFLRDGEGSSLAVAVDARGRTRIFDGELPD